MATYNIGSEGRGDLTSVKLAPVEVVEEGVILDDLGTLISEALLGVLLQELCEQVSGQRGDIRGEGEFLVKDLAVHLVGVFRVEGW